MEPLNPLEPSYIPEAPIFNYADFGTRLVAAIIDGIILAIASNVISFAFGFGAISSAGFGRNIDPEDLGPMLSGLFAVIGITAALQILYFAYFESSERQATIGKIAMKIRVTDMHGERITFMNALGRAAFRNLVSGSICLIGFIIALFTEKKQALHDLVASTIVTKDI
jgi:uncharacterized RDD family membrane protein YckC